MFDYAEDGNFKGVIKCITSGIDVNSIDSYDESAIIYALRGGYFNVIKYLIEQGADINVENMYGYKALVLAVNLHYSDIAN